LADSANPGVAAGPHPLPGGVVTYPLQTADPAKVGDFWPAARLVATPSGVAYLAYEQRSPDPVMLILLSQGAADDPAARDRLAGQVDRMDIDTVLARGGLEQDKGRLGLKFRSEADDPTGAATVVQAPWVALAFDQSQRGIDEARRVLAEVDLSWHPPQGQPAGPDYRLPWTDRVGPGLTRVWPLPWPGRRDRGGRLTMIASWLLMLLLTALAVLIAILIFSQAPEVSPPPPIEPSQETSPPPSQSPSNSESTSPPPTDGSPSPTDGSPSPSGASPSQTPGSPSPTDSGSPTPTGGSPSPTDTGSPGPGGGTGSPTISGSPTPPSRL
jgi:hypothetical protein